MNIAETDQTPEHTQLNAEAIDAAYLSLLDTILNLSCTEEACHIAVNEFEPLTFL